MSLAVRGQHILWCSGHKARSLSITTLPKLSGGGMDAAVAQGALGSAEQGREGAKKSFASISLILKPALHLTDPQCRSEQPQSCPNLCPLPAASRFI